MASVDNDVYTTPEEVLEPVIHVTEAPRWPGAVWVGSLDITTQPQGRIRLAGGEHFNRAHILLRQGRYPLRFLDVDINNGILDDFPRPAVQTAPTFPLPRHATSTPPISVILCTRDRPDQLRVALTSLQRQAYPDFEIIVVDNGVDPGTRHVVAEASAPNIRLASAPVPGLARARNVGVRKAAHNLVAFTDDDVLADRWWLQGIADGFAGGTDVGCVTGMVPSAEMLSPAQMYFDRRVNWASRCFPELFSLAESTPHQPLFPFRVGLFGTGANFALRRDTLMQLGGFDEALGAGSMARGGEDIDMFTRVLLAGKQLAYSPTAIIWHRNRADWASLSQQIHDYGTGLGAWLAKLALNPRTLAMMARRAPGGIRHLRQVTSVTAPTIWTTEQSAELGRLERRAVLTGPLALGRGRLAGAAKHPLLERKESKS